MSVGKEPTASPLIYIYTQFLSLTFPEALRGRDYREGDSCATGLGHPPTAAPPHACVPGIIFYENMFGLPSVYTSWDDGPVFFLPNDVPLPLLIFNSAS